MTLQERIQAVELKLIPDWKTAWRKASMLISGAFTAGFGVLVYEPEYRQPIYDFLGIHDPARIAMIGFVIVMVARIIRFKRPTTDA